MMLVGVEEITSRSVGASETIKHTVTVRNNPNLQSATSKIATTGSDVTGSHYKINHTGRLSSSQWQALAVSADGKDADAVLRLRDEARESEVASRRGQSLLFSTAPAGHLVADKISRDDGSWSLPAHGEGGGADIRELQGDWRIQDCGVKKNYGGLSDAN